MAQRISLWDEPWQIAGSPRDEGAVHSETAECAASARQPRYISRLVTAALIEIGKTEPDSIWIDQFWI